MSESSGEKNFEPSPSRLAKAKREGNVARSSELSANVAFAGALAAAVAVVPLLSVLARSALEKSAGGRIAGGEEFAIVAVALVPLLCGCICAVAAGFVQTGGLVVAPIGAKLERLNPAEGLKRMVSRDTALQLARAALAVLCVATAVAPSIFSAVETVVRDGSTIAVAAASWTSATHAMWATAAVGILFSAFEYLASRKTWLKKLRMTFDEVKRDAKEQNGDPQLRGKRKALHRDLSRETMAKVKDASFVVVNPTHVAVALEYRPPAVPIPVVLATAAGERALQVRELAVTHRIPIVENVPLARALFRDAKAGFPIPHGHYIAVAEVVAALVRSEALN